MDPHGGIEYRRLCGMGKRRSWLADGVALLAIVAAAFLVRAWPLGSTSLWWDELVHIHSAERESIAEVYETVKIGIPPGGGNAGAVPLDYLLLHLWLRLAPRPGPEALEVYYRVPALLFSVATVAVVFLLCRRFFDRSIAIVASTILALSISHALYAAEARFYALFGFLTSVNLYAYFAVLADRRSVGAWVRFTLVNLLYFLSGLFSLLMMAVEYVIVSVLLVREGAPGRSFRQRIAVPAASGFALAVAVGFYFAGTSLGASYGRTAHPTLEIGSALELTLRFFALGNDLLLWALPAGCVLVLVYGWRRGSEHFAMSLCLAAAVLLIPAIVELARLKEYYFHPRHALFLWPPFAMMTATALMVAARSLDPLLRRGIAAPGAREAVATVVVLAVLLATQLPAVERHLARPAEQFARTKALRDFKALAEHLRERVDRLAPGQLYLLTVERNEPGHLGNPMLSQYLQWYGLDRVLLRGTDDPSATRNAMKRFCRDGCVGDPSRRVQIDLLVRNPFDTKREIAELVDLPPMRPDPRPIGAVAVLQYARPRGAPPRRANGFDTTTFRGFTLYEKTAS